MSDTPDHLIPGWFTAQQWRELRPCIERLASKPGGVLLISVEIDPQRRNYPFVTFGTFDAAERQALRRALEAARKKREKDSNANSRFASTAVMTLPTTSRNCAGE